MDPNRCYELLLEAVSRNKQREARSYASVLRDWLSRGGFYPADQDPKLVDSTVAELLTTVDDESLNFSFTSICCFECDAGSHIASLEEAAAEGWTEISSDDNQRVSSHLGYCPECSSHPRAWRSGGA
jgi:hypothetical protein